MILAVIFDLDGTLVETEELKALFYVQAAVELRPELREADVALLIEVRQAGIKTAIASASRNTMTVLQRLNLVSSFDGIADGNSIVHGKPAPDVFIFAAGLVNTPTRDCLGVEDATAGIEAIKAAGMAALGIGPKERFPMADKVMDTLEKKTLQDLLA